MTQASQAQPGLTREGFQCKFAMFICLLKVAALTRLMQLPLYVLLNLFFPFKPLFLTLLCQIFANKAMFLSNFLD